MAWGEGVEGLNHMSVLAFICTIEPSTASSLVSSRTVLHQSPPRAHR